MQESLEEMKMLFIAGFGAITSFLGVLAIPVYILVASNVIDYATGIMAAPSRGEVKSSQKGRKGIVKKISMWLLVVVGALLDSLLIHTSSTLGVTLPFTYLIACVVSLWLCANEIISILENISDILGDEMPKFLLPIVKNIRSQVEEKMEVNNYGK